MTVRTRAQLNADADSNLPNNTNREITPAKVRQRIKDLADSAVLPEDITGAANKSALVDGDKFLILDSEASNAFKLPTLANLSASLRSAGWAVTGNIYIDAADGTSSAQLIFRNNSSASQGLFRWNYSNDWMDGIGFTGYSFDAQVTVAGTISCKTALYFDAPDATSSTYLNFRDHTGTPVGYIRWNYSNDWMDVDNFTGIAFGSQVTVAGSLAVTTWLKSGSYTVGTVPSAASAGAGALIFVTDETGGAVHAFSDGTNWRRVTDRNVIS